MCHSWCSFSYILACIQDYFHVSSTVALSYGRPPSSYLPLPSFNLTFHITKMVNAGSIQYGIHLYPEKDNLMCIEFPLRWESIGPLVFVLYPWNCWNKCPKFDPSIYIKEGEESCFFLLISHDGNINFPFLNINKLYARVCSLSGNVLFGCIKVLIKHYLLRSNTVQLHSV